MLPERVPPLRAALHNRSLMRVIVACQLSTIAEWAMWIGVIVYANESGGAAVAGAVSVALVVPAALAAPIAGTAADGPRPNRVLAIAYCVLAVGLSVAAVLVAADIDVAAVAAAAAVATTSVTFIHPSLSVVIPGLVISARELTAGNLLIGYGESSAVLLGPLIASGLLAVAGPALVLAVCAGLAILSALAAMPLARLDGPSRDHRGALRRWRTGHRRLVGGVRALSEKEGGLSLLVVLAGQYVMIGGLDLIYVVLAVDELHLDDSASGLLNASFGAGAVVGGLASTMFVAGNQLSRWIIAAMAVMSCALVTLAGTAALVTALCLFPVMGVSRAVLDITGRILMQRTAPQETLASIFAIIEALSLICMALGAILVQVLVGRSGAPAALLGLGCVIALLLLVSIRAIRRVDASADAPVVAIRLLRRIPVFSPLLGPALEGVARAAAPEHRGTGHVVVREGEPGDRYYAIARGEIDVSVDGRHVRTMGPGEGFGEVALMSNVPRTATVVARTDVDLLAIESAAFLTAVLGHDASTQEAWRATLQYRPDLAADD